MATLFVNLIAAVLPELNGMTLFANIEISPGKRKWDKVGAGGLTQAFSDFQRGFSCKK